MTPIFIQLKLADFKGHEKPSHQDQLITVNVHSLSTVTPIHPTTQLNYPGAHATLYIKGGGTHHVQETYDDVVALLKSREFGFINY